MAIKFFLSLIMTLSVPNNFKKRLRNILANIRRKKMLFLRDW